MVILSGRWSGEFVSSDLLEFRLSIADVDVDVDVDGSIAPPCGWGVVMVCVIADSSTSMTVAILLSPDACVDSMVGDCVL